MTTAGDFDELSDAIAASGARHQEALQASLGRLRSKVEALEAAYAALQKVHSDLNDEHAKLKDAHAKLQDAHLKLQRAERAKGPRLINKRTLEMGPDESLEP